MQNKCADTLTATGYPLAHPHIRTYVNYIIRAARQSFPLEPAGP
jgi:hypothetical protein